MSGIESKGTACEEVTKVRIVGLPSQTVVRRGVEPLSYAPLTDTTRYSKERH
jgi:hypothetical protein